jgi:hypothetical protein
MKAIIQKLLLIIGLLMLPAFSRAQLIFTSSKDGVVITGYNSSARNIIIPAVTNGLPVLGIGDFAFASYHLMTNVVIPESVTNIGQYAFDDCRGLSSVSLPASVTSLGRIPFGYCVNLTNISVDAANPAFSSAGGVLFDKTLTTLIEFPCGLGGLFKIPDSVTNIGFAACSSSALNSVSIPASVLFLDNHSFNFCLNLTNIAVASANPNYASLGGVLFLKSLTNLIQYPCALGTNYNVPHGVVSIGPDSFANSGLSRLTLPGTLQYMDYEMCYSCTNLASIVIPVGVTNLGISAFEQCTNLTAAYFLGNPPMAYLNSGTGENAFRQTPATVFYMPSATNWPDTYGDAATVLWNPQFSATSIAGGQFGFNFTTPTNATIVVEACTNLSQPVWTPLTTNAWSGTNTLIFQDAKTSDYPVRFYRMRSP